MKISKGWTASAITLALALSTGVAKAQYGQGPPPPQGGYGQGPGGYGQGPGGYGQGPGGWDAPPSEYGNREIARRGFRDGIEGAKRDVENHRRPSVNNRDEYRKPPVDKRDRREYRDAFRRGYDVAMRRMMNGRGPDRRDGRPY